MSDNHWTIKPINTHLQTKARKLPFWYVVKNFLTGGLLKDNDRLTHEVKGLRERLEGALTQATEAGKLALPLYIENENLRLEVTELRSQLDNPITYQNSNSAYLQQVKDLTKENAELSWRLRSAVASRDLMMKDWQNLLEKTELTGQYQMSNADTQNQ